MRALAILSCILFSLKILNKRDFAHGIHFLVTFLSVLTPCLLVFLDSLLEIFMEFLHDNHMFLLESFDIFRTPKLGAGVLSVYPKELLCGPFLASRP